MYTQRVCRRTSLAPRKFFLINFWPAFFQPRRILRHLSQRSPISICFGASQLSRFSHFESRAEITSSLLEIEESFVIYSFLRSTCCIFSVKRSCIFYRSQAQKLRAGVYFCEKRKSARNRSENLAQGETGPRGERAFSV